MSRLKKRPSRTQPAIVPLGYVGVFFRPAEGSPVGAIGPIKNKPIVWQKAAEIKKQAQKEAAVGWSHMKAHGDTVTGLPADTPEIEQVRTLTLHVIQRMAVSALMHGDKDFISAAGLAMYEHTGQRFHFVEGGEHEEEAGCGHPCRKDAQSNEFPSLERGLRWLDELMRKKFGTELSEDTSLSEMSDDELANVSMDTMRELMRRGLLYAAEEIPGGRRTRPVEAVNFEDERVAIWLGQ